MDVMLLSRGVRLVSLVIVFLAIRPAIGEVPSDPYTVRSQVDKIAGALTHFATRSIIVNRPLREGEIPSLLLAEQTEMLRDLEDLTGHPEELHRLLDDPSPRVRTIALGALFVREDPRDLPWIAGRIGDHAPTAPDLHDSMSAAGGLRPLNELESPQTVGEVANAMIQFYLDAARVPLVVRANGHPVAEGELRSAFDQYWSDRKDRAHCASWFLVRLERATRETDPVQPGYQEDLATVLAQIQLLPSPDREWTLLYALFGEPLPDPQSVVPEAALVYVAKAIGPSDLMKFLLLQPFSTDPDLRFTQSDPREFPPISRFILNHATELLRPRDGPVIRANAFKDPQRNEGSASLWIAASDWLSGIESPAKGSEQLKADFALFPPSSKPWNQREQIPLAVDLWKLSGAGEKKFLVDWFYGLSPRQNPSLGQDFLRSVEAAGRADTPELLAAIVADPHFDSTNLSVLAELLEAAGGGRTTSLVPAQEIYSHMPNQGLVFAAWRNVLRCHYGLPEFPVSEAH
jgi:hypothetical protein